MPQPFLDLGDIGFMIKGVGGSGGTQRVHADPAIFPHHVFIDGIGVKGLFLNAAPMIMHGAEEGTVIVALAGQP